MPAASVALHQRAVLRRVSPSGAAVAAPVDIRRRGAIDPALGGVTAVLCAAARWWRMS